MAADFELSEAFIPALHRPSSLLPIARHRQSISYLVETKQVVIVVGQTGSGKTTQIPQFLEQGGWCSDGKIIAVTQPRRVAVTTVAVRVAEEMRCKVGEQVGYSIRFEDATSASTRIKFLTDGLLLREALVDPLLSRYSVIMVDEAHERSLSTDVLLGVLKKIMKRRPELRIIISSATIQAEMFLKFFETESSAPQIISLEGRMFPVDTLYTEEPVEDYAERAVQTVFDIHAKEGSGDILVFLTGRDEIDKAIGLVEENKARSGEHEDLMSLPLYAGLSTEQQMYVFEPSPEGTRKVIFSTNIAEASVTIDGIVFVIDSGFVKLRHFDPNSGIESLSVHPISKASATQRAGRAGRTKPGKCFRLYTEDAFNSLSDSGVPEIQRSNLASMILQLKALGIDNIARFDFITPPPSQLIVRGLELLYSLGAVDDYARLTKPFGLHMAELAIEPMMAKVMLSATKFGCLPEILSIAAMTSQGGEVWITHTGERRATENSRRQFAAEEGDHLTLLNVYTAFTAKGKRDSQWCRNHHLNYKALLKATSIRAQLKRYLEKFGISAGDRSSTSDIEQMTKQICRCLTTGYFSQAAKMQPDGSFRTVNGSMELYAHPSSLMFNRKADWVIFHEIIESGTKIFIKDITSIEKGWLVQYAPQFYQMN